MNGITKLIAVGAGILVLTSMIAYFDPRDQSYDFSSLYEKQEVVQENEIRTVKVEEAEGEKDITVVRCDAQPALHAHKMDL